MLIHSFYCLILKIISHNLMKNLAKYVWHAFRLKTYIECFISILICQDTLSLMSIFRKNGCFTIFMKCKKVNYVLVEFLGMLSIKSFNRHLLTFEIIRHKIKFSHTYTYLNCLIICLSFARCCLTTFLKFCSQVP